MAGFDRYDNEDDRRPDTGADAERVDAQDDPTAEQPAEDRYAFERDEGEDHHEDEDRQAAPAAEQREEGSSQPESNGGAYVEGDGAKLGEDFMIPGVDPSDEA